MTIAKISTALVCVLILGACASGKTPDGLSGSSDITADAASGGGSGSNASNPGGKSDKGGKPSNPDGSTPAPGPSFDPSATPVPYDKEDNNEKITWERALKWWPYRPLLSYAKSKSPKGGSEWVYATSKAGGTKGDPKDDFSAVTTFWAMPDATPEKQGYFGITAGGGLALTVRFYPPKIPFDKTQFQGRRVTVRGHSALVTLMLKEPTPEQEKDGAARGTENLRWIQWQEDVPRDGGTLDWLSIADPTIYTEAEQIASLNAMIEVKNG